MPAKGWPFPYFKDTTLFVMSNGDNVVRKVEFCKPKKVVGSGSLSPPPVPALPLEKKPVPRKKKTSGLEQDLFEIHQEILGSFEAEYKNISELKTRYKRLLWITEHGETSVEKYQAREESNKLATTIQLIESGLKEAKYRLATEKILKEYTEIINKPVKIDFMKPTATGQISRKNELFIQFLNVAKDYANVQPVENQRKSVQCEDCNTDLVREDDYLFVCPDCGFAVKHFASVASFQENTRINVTQRYVYDKRAHFGDSIKKFQANQNTSIPEKVYQDLREKLKTHDIAVDKLTKDHLYEFLRLTGHSDHYEDITLIFSELSGKPAPNIGHLETQLYNLFDQVDPVYERVKPADRVNFLNGQFVLFKLLQKLKFPCKEEDFYILKTRDKMLEHDQIWRRICEELHWPFVSTV